MNAYLLLLVALPVAGLALAVRSLRGRRVGREPFCGDCGYNLTGLTSEQCPECGRSLNLDGAIIVGRRQRYLWSAIIGCFILLASLGYWGRTGYQYFQQHRYQLYPFSWVLADAKKDVADAMRELERRYADNRLTKTQVDALAGVALSQQALSLRPRFCTEWANLLEAMHAAGRLTPAQSEQYYRQLIQFSTVPPPRLKPGDPCLVAYGKDSRAPSHVYTAYFLDEKWTFDDQPVPKGLGGYSIWPADGGQTMTTIPLRNRPVLSPGRHKVVHSFRLRFYRADFFAGAHKSIDPARDASVHEQQIRQVGEFEVVAPEPSASTSQPETTRRTTPATLVR